MEKVISQIAMIDNHTNKPQELKQPKRWWSNKGYESSMGQNDLPFEGDEFW